MLFGLPFDHERVAIYICTSDHITPINCFTTSQRSANSDQANTGVTNHHISHASA